ncbi:MAG: hypothetical protein Q9190_006519 [Brigantiaea leucoxantha]
MPHSPFRKNIFPTDDNVHAMTHEIRKYRTDFEFGRLLDEEEMNSLLHMAEDLAQLYLFLGREFDVKERQCDQLKGENDMLEEDVDGLTALTESQKKKLGLLKTKLKRARLAIATKDQAGHNGDGTSMEAGFQGTHLEMKETVKPEKD